MPKRFFAAALVVAFAAIGGAGRAAVDTTPPQVRINKPANGSTVTGTVSIEVEARDDVQLAQTELFIDGALKTTQTASKFTFSWNTAGLSGAHTISARALDAAGNAASTSITVTVSGGTAPPPPPPPPPTAPAASFQGLGQLGAGIQSYAFGVSGDGRVVVGMSVEATGVLRAFRWAAATGMQDLGDLGGGSAEAHAATADGSVVVGRSWDNSPGLGYHGFRWTAAGGMQALPTAEGRDVSADGSVVVGGAVWTQSGGLQPPLGPCCQSAEGVSPDGGTITGWTSTANGIRAFRWTAATGVRDLGTLGGSESAGEDASANGAVVVGQARDRNEFWRAFRWTATAGMQDLGSLGGPMSRAFAVSDNGSVIVGRALATSSSASETAFRWTTNRQMQDLKRELLNAGLTSVQNWTLTTASRTSADGTVIVGFGLNPSRQWEAFRATLPVP